MGYLASAVRGMSWMGGLRLVTRAVSYLKIAILARILLPSQFGLYGIAALILSLVEVFTETGINVILIQEKESAYKKFINSAWIISIARGVVLFLLIFASAPYVSKFFNVSEAENLIKLISLVALIRGFINPSVIKFTKFLRFREEFIFRLTIFSIDSGVAIFLALITKSPSSLVWGLIAGALAEVLISFTFIRPRPKLKINSSKIKSIFTRGKWITSYGIFNYLFENIDDALTGKIIGTNALGLYQVAYKISSLPITEISNVFGKVSLLIYSKIANDKIRLRKAFIKATLALSAVSVPVGLLIFSFPKEIILFVLGSNWIDSSELVKILAFFGMIRATTLPANSLFFALKKQKYVTYITTFSLATLVLIVFPLINNYGLTGVAYSVLISSFVSIPVYAIFVYKAFKI